MRNLTTIITALIFSFCLVAEAKKNQKQEPEPSVVLRKSKPARVKTKGEDLEKVYREELKYLEAQVKGAPSNRAPASVKQPEHIEIFAGVEKKYVSKYVKMDVSKKVTQTLLDKTKKYTGEMALAPQGLFKLEFTDPEKTLLIMDGKNIWVVDYPIDGMQNKVQILHSKTHKNLKNQAFLGFLMGQGQMLKKFRVDNFKKNENKITYKLIPKEKEHDIEGVEIVVDAEEQLINSVSYWDSIGNKTKMEFKNQVFSSKVPPKQFQFTPPKNSSITNL